MRRIFAKDLQGGQRLSKALFTPAGVKLLPAGALVSRGRAASLKKSHEGPLYLAASYAELRAGLSGEALAGPEAIDEGALARLAARSAEGDARTRWTREVRRAERDLQDQLDKWASIERRVETAETPVEVAETGRLGWPSAARLRAYRDDRARRVELMHAAVLDKQLVKVDDALYVVRELVDLYAGYPDRFARLATMTTGEEHPVAGHALRVSALASAMAVRLGWASKDVELVGIAGLFTDLGMVLEPAAAHGALDDIAVSRLRRHPLAGAVMMENVEGLPEAARLAAAQHHEREDGSGYPLGVRGDEIHDVAKVLAAADGFAAAVAARGHRPMMKPHAALVSVCREALVGKVDRRAAMALVRVTGVFPVGASVALESGEAAVVASSRAEEPGRPVLRLLESESELDLARERGVRIAAELAASELGLLTA